MIGIYIQPFNLKDEGAGQFNQMTYHKFREKAVIEICIDQALLCSQAHKVIALIPMTERRNFTGTKFGNPAIINTQRQGLKRNILFEYYEELSWLEAIYFSARNNGFSHVVRTSSLCPFMPSWMMNSVIEEYLAGNYNGLCSTGLHYDEGFYLEIMPFWLLARWWLTGTRGPEFFPFENREPRNVERVSRSLVFQSLEQIELFDGLLENLELGYDLNELLEEINGKQKETHQ